MENIKILGEQKDEGFKQVGQKLSQSPSFFFGRKVGGKGNIFPVGFLNYPLNFASKLRCADILLSHVPRGTFN